MSKYGHRPINWFEAIVNKLGGEEAADRFLRGELVVVEARPNDELFQTKRQRLSADVSLQEMLDTSPQRRSPINRLEWYLTHPLDVPESWRGKTIFFPETARRDDDDYVSCLLLIRGTMFRQTFRIDHLVGHDDFVAVPVAGRGSSA